MNLFNCVTPIHAEVSWCNAASVCQYTGLARSPVKRGNARGERVFAEVLAMFPCWVVDSADRLRLEDCRKELSSLLLEERLAGATLLVFANKQDLPGALSKEAIQEALALDDIKSHHWCIIGCSNKKECYICIHSCLMFKVQHDSSVIIALCIHLYA
ncbi:hypothetical protein KUCAC02_000166 [Chaenocephalus aceratus]|uniref:Uncharacterized protein n=1 Tax=Chaenocephalus aceratus TaxID=36190 RepID=A0ACB9W612_CHAAC|nr:hypothetical protein KUCAC02_000166 [Chaenocephalus aceratus]